MAGSMAGLGKIIAGFDMACRQAFDRAARQAEESLKNGNHSWENDSQSLEDSITGFEAKIGDPYRNYVAENEWRQARQPGYVSPIHKNRHTNFIPPIPGDEDFGEEEMPVAVVTAYTRYAYDVAYDDFQDLCFGYFRDVCNEEIENAIRTLIGI